MHRAQNGGTFKFSPPDFSFINLKEFRNFKDFSKNSNPHIFLIFEDINSIFCTGTQANELIRWCDFRKNWTGVRTVLGCGSLRPPPPRNLSRLNTPGLIGLNRLAFNFVVLSELGNIDYTNLRISFNEPVFTHSQKVGEETESEEKVAKNVHD